MFGFFAPKLEIQKNIVTISNIPAKVIEHTLRKLYKTSRISNYLFHRVRSDSISFHEFFVLEFYFLVNSLINDSRQRVNVKKLKLILNLLSEQTWLANTFKTYPDIVDFKKLSLFKYTPIEYQMNFMKFYNKTVPAYGLKGMLLAAAPGTGKAQPLDALIKTPNGWSTMGDMKVGSKIITPKGTTTEVTAVYPQGEVDIYRITFYDGRTVECCGDHLWKVHVRNQHSDSYWKVLSVKDILKTKSFADNRVYVPLIEPEQKDDIELPIDPYLLGVILGDGCISQGRSIVISHPDLFIKEKVRSRLDDDMMIGGVSAEIEYNLAGKPVPGKPRVNSLLRKLDSLGLNRTLSNTKFVPSIYLEGSKQQKLDLLNGLMDTDGTADKGGFSSFTSSSLNLAESVQYLVRSLGGIATIVQKTKTFYYKGEKKIGLPAYQVNIRHKYPEDLFSLPRKKERLNNANQYCANFKLRINTIELIGRKQAQCISVADEERLYVTNDFVVTHNTFTSLALSECLGAERIIVICPNNALHTVWLKSTIGKDSLYIEDESVWSSASKKPYNGEKIVIFHYEALGQLQAMLPKLSQYKCALILDESHNFNELKSLRTNTFIEICKAPFIKDIIYSSGSPVKALAIETVPLLSVMDPLFTSEVRALFTRLFAGEATRLSEVLQRRLSVLSYKVDKSVLNREKPVIEDILVKIPNGDKFTLTAIATEMEAYTALRREQIKRELPETTKFYEVQIAKVTDIILNGRVFSSEFKKQFKINLETYRRYVKAIREGGSGFNLSALKEELVFCNRFEKETIMANIESKADRDKFKDAKTIMKYPDLKIRGECLGRILGKSRIEAINAMIPHIDYADLIDSTEKKTLVFTSFVDVVVRLDAFLKKDGYNPLLVYADFTADLNNIVKRFEAKEELNPLIATYASLSTAVPLVMADTIIVMNPPFRDYIMQQTIARVDRLGATTQTRIFNIILDTGDVPNISSRNVDIIEWSRKQSDAILGISVPTEEDELSITIEQLIEAHETKQHDPLLSVSNPLVTW